LKVKLILPALTEATSPHFRPIKYSLFPPLGLAALAGHLDPDDDVEIVDEHVMPLDTSDAPDLVGIEVYITSARRAYAIADAYRRRGVTVILGGLHVTSLPDEAARHADAIFLGPADHTFPQFLADWRGGAIRPRYVSTAERTLASLPPTRRDLIRRELYLVPNSIVVSRGCPHHCGFCYKDAFFEGGKSFYTQPVDDALAEIERLPGRHLYFLDDHLLGNVRFATALFDGMRGMGRLFQGASTVDAILAGDLIEKAADAGLRSIFIGLESLDPTNLQLANKRQNLGKDYERALARLDDLGVMVNGSFVFGLDGDGPDVFDRTVDWAVRPASRPRRSTWRRRTPARHSTGRWTRRSDPAPRLGSLRHAPRRVPPGADDDGTARGRVLARVRTVLRLVEHRSLEPAARHVEPQREALRLQRRVEEARADLGCGDPHAASPRHAPDPRSSARDGGTARARRAHGRGARRA
jgi:radical SAM superfamily enzyme YgiQ (UPF0313 family)